MRAAVDIVVAPDGEVRAIYSDAIGVAALAARLGGEADVRRATDVEPAPGMPGKWTADLGRSGGPVLGPFDTRQEALDAEIIWLRENFLRQVAGRLAMVYGGLEPPADLDENARGEVFETVEEIEGSAI